MPTSQQTHSSSVNLVRSPAWLRSVVLVFGVFAKKLGNTIVSVFSAHVLMCVLSLPRDGHDLTPDTGWWPRLGVAPDGGDTATEPDSGAANGNVSVSRSTLTHWSYIATLQPHSGQYLSAGAPRGSSSMTALLPRDIHLISNSPNYQQHSHNAALNSLMSLLFVVRPSSHICICIVGPQAQLGSPLAPDDQ